MSIQDQIKEDINSNDVLLYMKGESGNSSCGFSTRLVTILNHIGLSFETRNVLESDELRLGIKAYSNIGTLPLLYVKRNYAGGSDDIRAMHDAGTLVAFFEDQGIPTLVDPSKAPLIVDDISKEQIIKCAKAS